ncbi:MAG: hypothetical protein AABY16_00370, partial [Nanoarchaeota archaeon]
KGASAGLASLVLATGPKIILPQEEPKPFPKLNPNSSLDEMVAFLRNHREKNIDYKTLWPTNYQVISFGESHSVNEEERDITDHLDFYCKQGATHLAIEKSTDFQPVIDQYLQESISDEKFLEKLSEGSFFAENCVGNVKLIRKARDLGMKVVCMDSVRIKEGSRWQELKVRNKHMASVLADILEKEKNARIVAHCGAGHFSYSTFYRPIDESRNPSEEILPVPTYLLKNGIATFIVMYDGQRKVTNSEIEVYKDLDKAGKLNPNLIPGKTIGFAAKLAGVDQEKFGVRLDETVKTRNWGHYVIHLPQKDK